MNNLHKSPSSSEKQNELRLNQTVYIVIGVIFIGLSSLLFFWKREIHIFNPNYQIDNNLLGTYGDFIGGVLGTIFSIIGVVLVVETFILGQKQLKEQNKINIDLLESQRFNDLFFELLHLYQEEVKDLCGQAEQIQPLLDDEKVDSLQIPTGPIRIQRSEINYNNKDFFDVEKEKLQQIFKNEKSFDANQKEAIKYYMQFYLQNRTKIAAYFRTLYRIYDLIDNANLRESTKKNYLKIVRAQLTDSELFFLRYNAMTYYGENFIKYINKYHVLKHLPTFELLEFKDWWQRLNDTDRLGINIIFDSSSQLLRRILSNHTTDSITYKSFKESEKQRYSFIIQITNGCDVEISMIINKDVPNHSMEYLGFDKFQPKNIQLLLDCYIKEVFIYSNFAKFNVETELETYSNPITKDGNKIFIHSGIRNKLMKPLILKKC